MQLDATEVFIADLIACSTCFGHHYAHHQELQYYTVVAARGISCCGFQVVGLVWSWGLCVWFVGCWKLEAWKLALLLFIFVLFLSCSFPLFLSLSSILLISSCYYYQSSLWCCKSVLLYYSLVPVLQSLMDISLFQICPPLFPIL